MSTPVEKLLSLLQRNSLPKKWIPPVVKSVVLPFHAQLTGIG